MRAVKLMIARGWFIHMSGVARLAYPLSRAEEREQCTVCPGTNTKAVFLSSSPFLSLSLCLSLSSEE